jgi:hypothetical protein
MKTLNLKNFLCADFMYDACSGSLQESERGLVLPEGAELYPHTPLDRSAMLPYWMYIQYDSRSIAN